VASGEVVTPLTIAMIASIPDTNPLPQTNMGEYEPIDGVKDQYGEYDLDHLGALSLGTNH